MGTQSKQQNTNQFAPSGMSAYNQMTPAMSGAATGYINSPFSNPFFQTQQQMGTRQAQNLGGTQMSNIGNNLTTSGIGGGGASPMGLEMMQNQGRANSGMQAQLGFMNPVQNAQQMQQNSMGLAAGYSPLQTGSSQTQSTGGLGTWLPQLLGGALGAINPLSSLMHGMGGAAGAAGGLLGGGGGSSGGGWAGTGAPNVGSMQGYGQGMGAPSSFFSGQPQMPRGPQMGNSGYGF